MKLINCSFYRVLFLFIFMVFYFESVFALEESYSMLGSDAKIIVTEKSVFTGSRNEPVVAEPKDNILYLIKSEDRQSSSVRIVIPSKKTLLNGISFLGRAAVRLAYNPVDADD